MTSTAVDRFLAALEAGTRIPEGIFDDDVVLDFTVPHRRLRIVGARELIEAWLRWHHQPGSFQHLRRESISGGELVEYTLRWDEADGAHAVRHCHLLQVSGDRITADTAFCGGQWGPELLAELGMSQDVPA